MIALGEADRCDSGCGGSGDYRLSWHLKDGIGGWRVGDE